MSQTPDLDHKRKRDLEDNSHPAYHSQQSSLSQGQSNGYKMRSQTKLRTTVFTIYTNTCAAHGTTINYLPRNPERIGLIQGDSETFSDILTLIAEYEGPYAYAPIVNCQFTFPSAATL